MAGWRGLRTGGWAACGLVLLAALLLLIHEARLTSPAPQRHIATTITQIILPPPPPPPPRPEKPAPQWTAERQPSTAPAREPKPLPPKPKSLARAAAKPLTAEASPNPNQYAIPQGPDEGIVVGGGEGGGGGLCGSANYYLTMITSQLRSAILRNEKTDSRTFRVRARIWFDAAGQLQRAQLVKSTGDPSLDVMVRYLLGEVSVGAGMPRCLQPVTVWVSEPWEVWLGGASDEKTYQTQQELKHSFEQHLNSSQY